MRVAVKEAEEEEEEEEEEGATRRELGETHNGHRGEKARNRDET